MISTVLPGDLPGALDRAPAGCRVLSLDCFDTLLWRVGHAPDDVFADIGQPGGNAQQRRWAESHARLDAKHRHGRNEARIGEIYAALLPNADAQAHATGVEAELAAEARHCFAFAPTVELMRQAKRRGLRVIVVSDTYFGREQLGDLIAAAAGGEVRDLIDAIFCSSDYGLGKVEGLFGPVLAEIEEPAGAVLHIGDNLAADGHGAARAGIAALHLQQFAGETQQRLRLEAAVSRVLHAGEPPAWQPHRAQLALGEPATDDAAARLGYSVLGPVLGSFNRWLGDEVEALRAASHGRVHLLFLMRDGYLPLRVWHGTGGLEGVFAAAVEISRFAATAASFADADAVHRYLSRELPFGDVASIAQQFLHGDARAAAMARDARAAGGLDRFATAMRQPRAIDGVVQRSAAFAERLVRHVRDAADPQPGDTLVLVDLGYNGSVQTAIEPLLRRALGVEVAGRYLLLRQQELDGSDKKGLFDSRHYDMASLIALCGNVAVVEQLCTAAQGSVVDYSRDGTPVRKSAGIKAQQSEVRERVQQGCLRFVAEGDAAVLRTAPSDTPDARRQAAAAILARFMFLPMADELEVLRRFEHDVNLGCGQTVGLFDAAGAGGELRREGMFYLKNAERMFLPAELKGQGLALSLSLLAQRRFDLDLRMSDFRDGGVALPLLVADGREVSLGEVEASRTHDGFLSAVIPVGASQYAIGVQFGRLYEWVEVETAFFRPAKALDDRSPRPDTRRIAATPSFEGMEQVAGQLMRCTDETAFMMVPPPGGHEPLVLTVVFRPIVSRTLAPVAAQVQPATAGARA